MDRATSSKYFPTRQEAEANARLIAAAPDLLEALKEMLSVWEEDDPAYGAMHADKARAAIARAEGKV